MISSYLQAAGRDARSSLRVSNAVRMRRLQESTNAVPPDPGLTMREVMSSHSFSSADIRLLAAAVLQRIPCSEMRQQEEMRQQKERKGENIYIY